MTMTDLLSAALAYAHLALALAACLAGWRLWRGPRAQDRVLAFDVLSTAAMLLFLVTGIRTQTPFFFEAAMVIAVLGFVSNVALAKFLLRGEVIE